MSQLVDSREVVRTSEAAVVDRRGFLRRALDLLSLVVALPALGSLATACGPSESDREGRAAEPAGAQTGGAGTTASREAEPAPKAEAAASPATGGDEEELVTEIASNGPLLESLQFHLESPKADQRCAECLFYTPAGGGRGKCQLIPQGVVPESGWCASWQSKPKS